MVDPADRSAGPTSPGLDSFIDSLDEALEVARRSGVPHLLIGGVAVGAIGRPRWTRDIDLMVAPRSARQLLETFEEAGYTTDEREPMWLFKASRPDEITVDIIFRSQGGVYLDDEMLRRSIETSFHGIPVRTAGPEDLAVMKLGAHFEETAHQWFDALDLLSHPGFDWQYFEDRTTRCARRSLALLLYAQSLDIHVPDDILRSFWNRVSGDGEIDVHRGLGTVGQDVSTRQSSRLEGPDDALFRDLDIELTGTSRHVLVTGEIETRERREQMLAALRNHFPEARIEDRTSIRLVETPAPAERVS